MVFPHWRFEFSPRTETPATGTSVRLTTILKDHLGSTDALVTGTWTGSAFTGATVERQSFDPWGERRDPDTLVSYRTTDADPFRASAQDYDRGYTGHEQLDDSGLIHMNGRIYDPELGRMLSPDPYVQVPEYSQNFNRYSYVMNNPLNLTDPSGYSWLGDLFHKVGNWIKENWRTIVVIVVVAIVTWGVGTAFLAGAGSAGSVFATAGTAGASGSLTAAGMAATGGIAGAVGGGLGAALTGGDGGDILRGALVGGIQGAISGGILHGWGEAAEAAGIFSNETALHVAGHGVLGGAANEAMGGKFQDGFYSAAAGAAAANLGWLGGATKTERTINSAIIGGTAAAIGGGKFANGAYTAAFQHLLNFEFQKGLDGKPDYSLPPNRGVQGDVVFGGIEIYAEGAAAGGALRWIGSLSGRLFGPSVGRIFWSGGEAAKVEAQTLAKATGGTTLEMTIPGKVLDKLTTPKTFAYLKPFWNFASERFARGAVGPVKVVQPLTTGVRIESVWATREYGILFKKGNPINYHIFP